MAAQKNSRTARLTPDAPIPLLGPGRGLGNACVVVIYGPDLGKRAEVGVQFDIGRSAKNALFIDQESISRHHARLTFDGSRYFIEDMGSTNGTFVNDEPVTRQEVADGDQIRVGRSILKFMSGDNVETNYHEEIYRLMTVDALTKTYNRRYFFEALEREANRTRRYQRDLSLVLFEVDAMEELTRAHGQVAGDDLLRQLAAAIRPRLRQQDIFARLGPELFGVLLPEVPIAGARVTAEKVRRIVESSALVHEGKPVAATVSLGIATFLEQAGTEGEAVFSATERALTEAKRKGNCVVG